MFLRAPKRYKDGKEHRYWSIDENQRLYGGKVSQRQTLYYGELNNNQKEQTTSSVSTRRRPRKLHYLNAAKAILDERTQGKAVQLYHKRLTQHEMPILLHNNWPDHELLTRHISTAPDQKNGAFRKGRAF